MRKTKLTTRVAVMFVILGATALGFIFVELIFRIYLFYSYTYENAYPVTITDTQYSPMGNFNIPGTIIGPYPANQTMSIAQYSHDNNLLQTQHVSVNNFGWISKHNYTRQKSDAEFRIAIIGDSLTACINSDIAWPDITQQYLNSDIELKKLLKINNFSVLNLGVNGIGFQFMANPLALIAKRFSSDMVVINFPIEDLARRHAGDFTVYPPEPIISSSEETRVLSKVASNEIDGVHIGLDCIKHPFHISNPDCKMHLLWYIPPHIQISKEFLSKVKQKFGSQITWNRFILSTRLLTLVRLMGGSVIHQRSKCSVEGLPLNPIATSMACDNELENMNLGLQAIEFIRSLNNWDVIVTHNVLLWHLPIEKNGPLILKKFDALAKTKDIRIFDMGKYLPTYKGAEEWAKWYNMPHDGHFSNYGAHVYGEAMYKLIRERLLQIQNSKS